jgi:hypothetical protein
MDEGSASHRVKFVSKPCSRRFVLFYSWLNQPPNFGCAASAGTIQINDGESRQAYFPACVGDMGTGLAAASVWEQADNVQIHEKPGR